MGSMGGGDVVRVAEMFSAVARTLAADDQDLDATLQAIVDLAVELLDACESAGISLVKRREITSPASSGELASTVDRIQSELGEGPCLDAVREHEVFETGDLAQEGRWPAFAERARQETGVTSVLGLRLFLEEDTLGALNLYATRPDAFDDTDAALASVFAAHAAVALANARRQAQLERKAATRDLIGEAKGILMARSNVDEEQAFQMLVRASQRMNVKVVDVAARIVHPEDRERSDEIG